MQKTIPTLGTNSWGRRLMPATIALGLLVVLGFAPSGFAQCPNGGPGPLCFGNNFFVTGDYVVAGANMSVNIANGFATGTITIPDANPGILPGKTSTCTINGITKTNCVPPGAEILAVLLYWQTVEKIGVIPGQPGSGQNGFFGPVLNNVPQLYPITGATNSQNTVSFSNGGCSGTSTGKGVKTYRADVRGFLPQDINGNVLANGTFEVMLPSSSNTTPITLGATLIIIYRILSPNVPLNSIVIYDGAFAPGNNTLPPSTMTQTVQGFYEAANAPVSRLTHIASQGKSKKFETVSLGPNPATQTPLPSLYGSGQSPFIGWYGPWDNPTWTFQPTSYVTSTGIIIPANPVQAGSASATTKVMADINQPGCPSWGAVILSTTVQHTDNDGLLDVWKTNQGYCDASINEGSCTPGVPSTGWVALPGTATPIAGTPHPDVFVQLDYMCSKVNGPNSCDTNPANVTSYSITSNVITVNCNCTNPFSMGENVLLQIPSVSYLSGVVLTVSSASATQFTAAFTHADVGSTGVAGTANGYSFNPTLTVDPVDGKSVVDKVVGAFAGIGTSTNHTPVTLHVIPTHAIQEQTCQDISGPPLQLCPFASQPGVVGWPGGVNFLQNQLVDSTSDQICTTSPPGANCVPRFQRGKKDSWHYALFAHALGLPKWTLQSGTLTSVVQSGQTVTFTTSTPHGLTGNINVTRGNFNIPIQDPTCASGRVTVAFAITNHNLNGIYCVQVTGQSTFTIQVANSASATYTFSTDPNLVVVPGQATQVSGFSDIAGPHSVIALGSWKTKLQTWQAKTGTFMHELGHSLGLTHGGFYFDSLTSTNNNYTPTVEANCKPNHQSVMNYDFQIDLLNKGVDQNGNPVQVVDYSGQSLDPLNKLVLQSPNPFTTTPTYDNTVWHGTAAELGGTVGSRLPVYCTGAKIPTGTDLFRVGPANSPTSSLFWEAGQDINLDANTTTEPPLRGHNDWTGTAAIPGIDMRQIGATGSLSAAGLTGSVDGGGGGLTGAPIEGGGGGVISVPNGGGGGVVGAPIDGGGGGVTPIDGGGGGLTPISDGGGGGLTPPDGGAGGLSEINQATANSFTRPPTNLTASEAASPRTITLNWGQPTFGLIVKYKIYRSDAGGPFNQIGVSVPPPTPPATTLMDHPACNPGGYRYQVTAVIISDITNAEQESVGSNIVSTSGQTGVLLTACYYTTTLPPTLQLTGFTSPPAGSTFTQGTSQTVTWQQLRDDDTGVYVNPINPAVNTLLAIGPIPHDGACSTLATPPVFLNHTGTYPFAVSTLSSGGSGITLNGNQASVSWNPSLAGCYFLELDLDSSQFEQTPTAFTVLIFVSDNTPHILPTPLPNGVVWTAYPSTTLQEAGGIGAVAWTVVPGSGSLPPGISLDPASGILSGTPTASGSYTFTVKVTDSVGNFGMQAFMLVVDAALLVAHSVTDGSCAISQLDATNGSLLRQFGTLPGTLASPCTELRAHLALSGGFLYRSNGVSLNTISQFSSNGMLVRTIVPNTSGTPSIVPIARDFGNQSIYMVDTFGGTTTIRHLDDPSTGASSPFAAITFYTGIGGTSDLYFGGPSGSQALFALTQTDPAITPCFNTGFNPCPYRVAKINSNGNVQFLDNPNLIVPFVFDVGSLAVDPTSGTATSGNIYVATGNVSAAQPGSIVELSAAGAALGSFSLNDGKPSLDVDLSGNIFVGRASSTTGEISVFSASGVLVKTILVPNATRIIDVLIAP